MEADPLDGQTAVKSAASKVSMFEFLPYTRLQRIQNSYSILKLLATQSNPKKLDVLFSVRLNARATVFLGPIAEL